MSVVSTKKPGPKAAKDLTPAEIKKLSAADFAKVRDQLRESVGLPPVRGKP